MKKLLFFLILFPIIAQASINAGFVKGIWYSQTPFFDGDNIRIYSAIQNHSDFDIQGKVQFSVNNNAIGTADFSAIKGRLIEVWADWTAIQGNNNIQVKITEAFKSVPGQDPEPIILESISFESNIFIDIDTDNDEIGNQEDADDDNDGILDKEEISQGSDPLVKNDAVYNIDSSEKEHYSTSTKVIKGAYDLVKKITVPVIEILNEFADNQKENIDTRKHILRIKIQEEQGNKKLLKQAELILLASVGFILGFKPLFYIVLLVLVYFIFKVIFKIIKR